MFNGSYNKIERFFWHNCFLLQPKFIPRNGIWKKAWWTNKIFKRTKQTNIKIIVPTFNPNTFYDAIKKVENFENLKEGGMRCYACYKERLEATAKFAKQNNFDFFGTTLSVSPYKHSDWLNEIGINLQKELGIKFLVSDFKKKDGYKLSQDLSKKFNLYRQNYCGCVFSLKEQEEKETNN